MKTFPIFKNLLIDYLNWFISIIEIGDGALSGAVPSWGYALLKAAPSYLR
jgi:hypothetical protein